MQMPRWERRIRIMLDWTVALLFKNDVVKLDLFGEEHPMRQRETRSGACAALRRRGGETRERPFQPPSMASWSRTRCGAGLCHRASRWIAPDASRCRSPSQHARRICLPACSRHAGAQPTHQSTAPVSGTLRDAACAGHADLCVEVSPGTGVHAGAGSRARRRTGHRRRVDGCAGVGGDNVDAAPRGCGRAGQFRGGSSRDCTSKCSRGGKITLALQSRCSAAPCSAARPPGAGRTSARHGVVAGVGLAILANSRPFDGLLIALLVLGWVVIAGLRDKRLLDIIQRTMPACLLVLAPVIAWMGYYNFRVTGNALQLPYTLYARQYQVAPLFYFQRPRPVPEYRHARLAEYWTGYDLQEWQRQSTLNGWVRGAVTQIATLVRAFFAPPTLWAAIIALPLALRRHRACRAAAAVLALFILLHVVLTPWMRMHYMGAAAPLFFAVITFSLIELSRRAIGTLLAGLILLVQASAVVTLIAAMSANPHPAGAARARIVSDLHRLPGEHLVVVSYGAGPQHLFEWVYNDADLDGSRILFARDMGSAEPQITGPFCFAAGLATARRWQPLRFL